MAQTDIDTGTNDLLAHIDGNVGAIVFNRPDRRNALSNPMYDGFRAALGHFAQNDDVRVVMITGSGGAFCAGGDVKGMHESNETGTPREGRPTTREGNIDVLRRNQRDVSLFIHKMQKPVVAAIPGAAAGAGMSIALSADIRLAAERALIVTAFSGIGASGDFGGSWFLTQLVGHSKAKELYFMNPRLTAAEALDLGIVNRVLPDDGFEQAALAWCHELASRPPIAMRYIKENINRAIGSDLATCLDAEAQAMITTMATEDHHEAAAAFVEKRTPTFNGR